MKLLLALLLFFISHQDSRLKSDITNPYLKKMHLLKEKRAHFEQETHLSDEEYNQLLKIINQFDPDRNRKFGMAEYQLLLIEIFKQFIFKVTIIARICGLPSPRMTSKP